MKKINVIGLLLLLFLAAGCSQFNEDQEKQTPPASTHEKSADQNDTDDQSDDRSDDDTDDQSNDRSDDDTDDQSDDRFDDDTDDQSDDRFDDDTDDQSDDTVDQPEINDD